MNNDQFRRLVNASQSTKKSPSNGDSSPGTSRPSGAPSLGSRIRSSIPMTPRSVAGAVQKNFAQQLAERQAEKSKQNNQSRKPKYPGGYVDPDKKRTSELEDARAKRLHALEGSLKKEEIDRETYDRLRAEIAGGDLSSTHLVKGLDFKLLERIRRGEDVSNPGSESRKEPQDEDSEKPGEPAVAEEDREEDIDAAFEQLEQKEVTAIHKEKAVKKGQMAPPSLVPGKKRTRDQILAELKASRAAAAAAKSQEAEQAPRSGFRRITEKKQPGSRIERDSRGREVLIIIDEDGHERRKVRKTAPGDEEAREKERLAMMPDKNVKPLGMEVPEAYRNRMPAPEEDDDDDIFGDVGDDYDPLAGIGSGSDSESDTEKEDKDKVSKKPAEEVPSDGKPSASMTPPPVPKASGSRNYFADSKTKLASEEKLKAPSLSDPTIAAALKKAASLRRAEGGEDDESGGETAAERKAREERRRRMLENDSRDAEDLDMGFGTSRFEDEEDFEADEKGLKLSNWGDDGDEDGQGGGERRQKRKRGPKKRKGDGNSAADVMRVLEGRKKQG